MRFILYIILSFVLFSCVVDRQAQAQRGRSSKKVEERDLSKQLQNKINEKLTWDSLGLITRVGYVGGDVTTQTLSPGYTNRDGSEAFFTANGDSLIQIGGWISGPTDNQQWLSTDQGVTWAQQSNAAWTGRHTFGFAEQGGFWYVIGADIQATRTERDEVWRSSNGLTWSSRTLAAEWGHRILIGAVSFENNLYVYGGQDTTDGSSVTVHQDVWKSTDGGSTWNEICESCLPAIGNLSGTTAVWNGRVWIVAGEKYDDFAGHTRYNTVYSSEDLLVWKQHNDLPVAGISYPKTFVSKGRLWFYGGATTAGGNQRFLYNTSDGENWVNGTTANLPVTHAAAVAVQPADSFFVVTSGNIFNDVYKVETNAILQTYQQNTLVSTDNNRFNDFTTDITMTDGAGGLSVNQDYNVIGETENGLFSVWGNNITPKNGLSNKLVVHASAADPAQWFLMSYVDGLSYHFLPDGKAVGTIIDPDTNAIFTMDTLGNAAFDGTFSTGKSITMVDTNSSATGGLSIRNSYGAFGTIEGGLGTVAANNAIPVDGTNNKIKVSTSASDPAQWLHINETTGLSYHYRSPAAINTQHTVSDGELFGIDTLGRVTSQGDRGSFHTSNTKNLTDAITSMWEVAMPVGAMTGGEMAWSIEASNGTDHQVLSGKTIWAAVNKAGVYTQTLAVDTTVTAASSGTLTAVFNLVSGTNKLTMRVTPTGSLTETIYRINYIILNNTGQIITIL